MIERERGDFLTEPKQVFEAPWGIVVGVGIEGVDEPEVERARRRFASTLRGEFARLGFKEFAGLFHGGETEVQAFVAGFESEGTAEDQWRFVACPCTEAAKFLRYLSEIEWRACKAARHEVAEVLQMAPSNADLED